MIDANKPKLIIIAGPTATGKSAAAVKIAKVIGGEHISADSIQVYKGMNIGSAKVTEAEMQGVPHHLIDVIDIDRDYNVAVFKEMASEVMKGIYARGHIPIICGGTGFYIQALIYDIDFENEDGADDKDNYRADLEKMASEGETEELKAMLKEKDPKSYESLDLENTKRIIRALEYMHIHTESIYDHNEREKKKREDPPSDISFFVLHGERQGMYDRINQRVDKMLAEGLEDEVKELKEKGLTRSSTAGQGIGYKEMLSYLDGECTLPEAAEQIKLNTRHFAKRQLTWFRREKNTIWIDIDKGDSANEIRKYL